MKQEEPLVYPKEITRDRLRLQAKKRCKDLSDKIKTLSFNIQHKKIVMSADSYMHQLEDECLISIESIPDVYN